MSDAKRYIINGKPFTPVNDEQVIELVKRRLKADGTLSVQREEKEPDLYELLETIQEAAWYAQAYLSGIEAVTEKIMAFIAEDSFDDAHTVQHISWLHIAAKEKIEEMQSAIEDIDEMQSAANRAKRDSGKSEQAAEA